MELSDTEKVRIERDRVTRILTKGGEMTVE